MPAIETPAMRIGDAQITTEATIAIHAPYDGRLLGQIPSGTRAHVDQAVAAAQSCLVRRDLPTYRRAEILDAAAARLKERAEEFAQGLCHEVAKPIRLARGEVARAIDTLRFSAAAARTKGGELLPIDASAAGEGRMAFVRHDPVGVIAAITPFNFPLNLACHKIGPAIAAGCPLVLKPAPNAALTPMRLVNMLLDECGLPPGWITVIPCPDSVAPHLVEHPDVALVSFTGSPGVGWGIRQSVPRKRVALELGNNSPLIIEPDGDWRAAVERIKATGFGFAGQSCISVQRLLIHEDIVEEVSGALVEAVSTLKMGDPADPQTDLSVLIRERDAERVQAWIDEAVEQGARLLCGGQREGRFIQPTVLIDIRPQMKVCCREIFGPVVVIQPYAEFEGAIAAANDTIYGLQAGVFTRDLGKAMRASEALRFGGVLINEVPTWRADHMPYGGRGESGNTREGPLWSMRHMLEEKVVIWTPPG